MTPYKGLLLAACLAFSSSSFADGHRDAAYQLLDVMKLDQLMSDTIDSMLVVQMRQNPSLQPYEAVMKRFFSRYLSGASLREDFADMYEEAFTEEELNTLVEFYRTPIGEKTLKLMPTLTAQGAALGEQRVRENAHVLQEMIEQEALRIQRLQSENN